MKKRLVVSAMLALGMVTPSSGDVGLLDLSPLYKDVAINPGMEMIQPFIGEVDANTVRVRFDVYSVDSNFRLFGTEARLVDFPAIPCANPVWQDQTFHGLKFLGKDALRSHMAIGLITACQESAFPNEYKEAFKTFVYSAAVNTFVSDVWAKTYNHELIGFDAIDVAGDATNELILTMAVAITTLPNPDSTNSRTVAIEGLNGTVLFDKLRAMVR